MALSCIFTEHCVLISGESRPNKMGHNARRSSYLCSVITLNLTDFKTQLICTFTYVLCVTFLYYFYLTFLLLQLKTMMCMKCIIHGHVEAWDPVQTTLRATLKIHHKHQSLLVIISAYILHHPYLSFSNLMLEPFICLEFFSEFK
jgi:hypothetical protein